jgi:hypothetical protein
MATRFSRLPRSIFEIDWLADQTLVATVMSNFGLMRRLVRWAAKSSVRKWATCHRGDGGAKPELGGEQSATIFRFTTTGDGISARSRFCGSCNRPANRWRN